MKSYIAVAALMAAVASAKPVAEGWDNVYGTTTVEPVHTTPVYETTTTKEAVHTTPVYETTTSEEAVHTTPVYETTTTKKPEVTTPVYETTTTKKPVVETTWAPVYETTTTKKPEVTNTAEYEWEAVSSIPYEPTTKKATPTTSWAVWATPSGKPSNTTSPIPKYTGAASQQGVAIGAMALAGVAMLF